MPKTPWIHRNVFWDHLTLPNIGNSISDLQISTLTIGPKNLPSRPGVPQETFWILGILGLGFWIMNYEFRIVSSGLWILNYELSLMKPMPIFTPASAWRTPPPPPPPPRLTTSLIQLPAAAAVRTATQGSEFQFEIAFQNIRQMEAEESAMIKMLVMRVPTLLMN